MDDVVTQKTNQKGDAMAYLLRYETMVRQQEAEDMAVLAHIRPCVSRLLELCGNNTAGNDISQQQQQSALMGTREHELGFLTQEISFVDLQTAVRRLEQQQKERSSSHTNDSSSKQSVEHLTTDRQLMMVLRLLTQKVVADPHPHSSSSSSNEPAFQEHEPTNTTMISWAEIVQCYKVCIAGMLTLQHLPSDTALRARARDRTLAMLSLFEPPSTLLFQEDVGSASFRVWSSSNKHGSAERGAHRGRPEAGAAARPPPQRRPRPITSQKRRGAACSSSAARRRGASWPPRQCFWRC